MTSTHDSRMTTRQLNTVARTPEDILAYMVHALGYWPRNSLVVLGASDGRLGPCLRVNLPTHDSSFESWCQTMRGMIQPIEDAESTAVVFAAAFAETTSCSAVEGGGTAGSNPEEAIPNSFLCETSTVLSLLATRATIIRAGLHAPGAWVVDVDAGRWGSVIVEEANPGEADGERREMVSVLRVGSHLKGLRSRRHEWLVEPQGNLESILTSPVGVALAVEGYSLREAEHAVADHCIFPGALDVRSAVGPNKEGRLCAASRAELRAVRGSDVSLYRLDAELTRLAESFRGQPRPRNAMLDAVPTVDEAALTSLATTIGDVAGLHSVLVLTACNRRAAELFSRGMRGDLRQVVDGTSIGARIVTGRHRIPPNRDRMLAARVLLSIVEYFAEPESQDFARVANAYLSWFFGLSSQAHRYLEEVQTLAGMEHALLCRRLMSLTPIPAWLGGSGHTSVNE
ncbi:DUF4192 family protein [Rothia sp. p3-SID1597]|nr:DUF4192 family protein [Rothia sp. p3-SID1597]